jgi:hypothetical protein
MLFSLVFPEPAVYVLPFLCLAKCHLVNCLLAECRSATNIEISARNYKPFGGLIEYFLEA